MKPRVGFFVDGFNLYHSLAQVTAESGDASVKWLDLQRLLSGILPLVDQHAAMGSWHYFTALRSTYICRILAGCSATGPISGR